MTISNQFYKQAVRQPNKVAVIHGERQVTYLGLLMLVQQQAHILRLNGLKHGDHLMTQLEGLDFVVMMLAAADAGVCLVPMGRDASQEAVSKAYAATDCKFLINAGMDESAFPSCFNVRLKFAGKADDNYLLITSSGSTGEPKPILLKQGTKLRRMAAMRDCYGVSESDVTLISTPLHHSMGQRLVLMSVLTGGTLVLMDGWSVSRWRELVNAHKVTFAVPVATQVKQIVEHSAEWEDAPSLRTIVASSAPLNIPDTNLPIYDCYGTTEIAVATSTEFYALPDVHVGKPLPGVDVRIAEDGEIQVKTPLLFDGYYKQPESTAAAMTSDGYFKTGDIGCIDEDGNLHYLGRIKEIINVGGTKVFPQDVEAILADDPSIEESAAFPVYSEVLGEVVGVAYVLREGCAPFDLKELQRFYINDFTDAQLPRFIVEVEVLPRTDTGKVQRMKLAEMLK